MFLKVQLIHAVSAQSFCLQRKVYEKQLNKEQLQLVNDEFYVFKMLPKL